MGRERIELTEKQLQELQQAAGNRRDGATRSRYQAVWLYGKGYAVREIEAITGCRRSSLMGGCRSYRVQGLAGLVDARRGGNRARLCGVQLAELGDRLHRLTPSELFGEEASTPDGRYWSVPDVQRAVQQWYGVHYSSRGSYHRLLHLCGFSYQRAAKVYKSRSTQQIAQFEEQLEKIERCGADGTMASDEAALYLQATTMAVWAARGQPPVIRVHPDREKVDFYGTLNLHTGQAHITRSTMMNAVTTAQPLQTLLDAYPAQPLLLLWHRAPWHRAQPIRDVLAANPRLQIMELPVAAPDLNPQEQVWKATRRAVSHQHAHARLPTLADAFEHHLTTTTFPTSFLARYDFDHLCSRFK